MIHFGGCKGIQQKLINFSVLHFLFGMVLACYLPFFVVYLLDRKIDNTTIGNILMINSLVSVFAQILWGIISDRIGSIQRVFISCLTCTILLNLLLPFTHQARILIILLPMITFFLIPLIPLLDSWTLKGIKKGSSQSYGSIRLWNSIGYTVTAVFAGKLVSSTSINSVFFLFSILGCMIIFIGFKLKIVDSHEEASQKARLSSLTDIKKLLKNYQYVTFLFSCCILYIAVSPLFSFIPELMNQSGGNEGLYGIAVAVSAISEVPIFYLSLKIINKFKIHHLIAAAFAFYALRMLILSSASSPQIIIISQCMQSITYSLFLIGSVHYIDSLAPKELKATALSLGSSVYGGLGGIIGNYFAGRLIDIAGIFSAYRAGSFICFSALVLFILFLWLGRCLNGKQDKIQTGFEA
ncbi:MAG: MFS transporter [Clostridia bacterium]|nr:MFS transporter [Clostridia bacterium]